MMTKKDFIALADAIRGANSGSLHFSSAEVEVLAAFCASRNLRFDRGRWFDYIYGKCGPSGGAIRKPKGGSA
jgi:hypothetical protein